MDNSNLPANPLVNDAGGQPCFTSGMGDIDQVISRTKREQFATMSMQGLCAQSGDYHAPEDLVHDAVMYADALLAELEKKS